MKIEIDSSSTPKTIGSYSGDNIGSIGAAVTLRVCTGCSQYHIGCEPTAAMDVC